MITRKTLFNCARMLPAISVLVAIGGCNLNSGSRIPDTNASSFCQRSDIGTFDSSIISFTELASIAPITEGFSILEGPIWYQGRLYMSHIGLSNGVEPNPSNIVVMDDTNTLQTFQIDAGTNGLALSAQQKIYAAVHGRSGRVSELIFNDSGIGKELPLTQVFEGKPYNSPNDLTISSTGHIYFSDPSWQAPTPAPQAQERVYHLSPDGSVVSFGAIVERPNGIMLSLDESRLFVGGVNGLFAFQLEGGAVIDSPTAILDEQLKGIDGMSMDCEGNLYVTASGSIVVINPAGEQLGAYEVRDATNVVFGGADGKTLYVTTLGATPKVFISNSAVAGLPY